MKLKKDIKFKQHFCSAHARWYADSSSFAKHMNQFHKGKKPKGSITPRSKRKVGRLHVCTCKKGFYSWK